MKEMTIALPVTEDYEVLFWNHDKEVIAFTSNNGTSSGLPFLMRWKQPKEVKEFLIEILSDLDNGVADESEIYMMSIDLNRVATSVGELAPMNMIVIYREYDNDYSCYYGCSAKSTYQSITLSKHNMADFIKFLLRIINDRGIKREIFL